MTTTELAQFAARRVTDHADIIADELLKTFPPYTEARAMWKYGQVKPSAVMLGKLYWSGQMFKIEVVFLATGKRKDIPLDQIVEVLP